MDMRTSMFSSGDLIPDSGSQWELGQNLTWPIFAGDNMILRSLQELLTTLPRNTSMELPLVDSKPMLNGDHARGVF